MTQLPKASRISTGDFTNEDATHPMDVDNDPIVVSGPADNTFNRFDAFTVRFNTSAYRISIHFVNSQFPSEGHRQFPVLHFSAAFAARGERVAMATRVQTLQRRVTQLAVERDRVTRQSDAERTHGDQISRLEALVARLEAQRSASLLPEE